MSNKQLNTVLIILAVFGMLGGIYFAATDVKFQQNLRIAIHGHE